MVVYRMINVHLKRKREKNILRGNPWIFSGSIHSITGNVVPGSLCTVFSHDGDLIGTGYINRQSAITIRILTWGDHPFTDTLLSERIDIAINHRSRILSDTTDSCRLINSEGDFLPGLIVDKFGKGLVIQILTAGTVNYSDRLLSVRRQTAAGGFNYCTP